MNEIVVRMIDTQMLLFLYMLCGFVISRLNIIRDSNRGALVRLGGHVVLRGAPGAHGRSGRRLARATRLDNLHTEVVCWAPWRSSR